MPFVNAQTALFTGIVPADRPMPGYAFIHCFVNKEADNDGIGTQEQATSSCILFAL